MPVLSDSRNRNGNAKREEEEAAEIPRVAPGQRITEKDDARVAREAAARIAAALESALAARLQASLALSGGNTPRAAYTALAGSGVIGPAYRSSGSTSARSRRRTIAATTSGRRPRFWTARASRQNGCTGCRPTR